MKRETIHIELCWSNYIPIEDALNYNLDSIGVYEFVHFFPEAVRPSLLYVGQTLNCFRARICWDRNHTTPLLRDLATHFRVAEILVDGYRLDELAYKVQKGIILKIETDIIDNYAPAYNKRRSYIDLPFDLVYSVSDTTLKLNPYPYKYG